MYTTLISAAELANHFNNPDWVVIDCRHDLTNLAAGLAMYKAGHIQGAVFADIEHELSGAKHDAQGVFRGRHPLPEREDFIECLRNLGVSDGTQVVAYDGQGGMYAARLWWMLRWIGHEKVAVLDGGLQAWEAAGFPVDTDIPSKTHGHILPRPTLVATVDVADVLANLNGGRRTVIDARAPDRFRGENETIDPVGGRIPGARNRFFRDNLQADGRFKTPAMLRDELAPLAADPSSLISQCGSGVTACHNLLALEVAGLKGAALYPGSWSEWCADPARPIETGAA